MVSAPRITANDFRTRHENMHVCICVRQLKSYFLIGSDPTKPFYGNDNFFTLPLWRHWNFTLAQNSYTAAASFTSNAVFAHLATTSTAIAIIIIMTLHLNAHQIKSVLKYHKYPIYTLHRMHWRQKERVCMCWFHIPRNTASETGYYNKNLTYTYFPPMFNEKESIEESLFAHTTAVFALHNAWQHLSDSLTNKLPQPHKLSNNDMACL